jgi:hypothetical protein
MKTAIALFGCLGIYLSAFAQSYGDYNVIVLVEGNGFAHQTVIYFDDESLAPPNVPTYSYEICCDAQLALGNSNQPQVFTEVVEPPGPPNNHRLSINGLPLLYEYTSVPLGFLPGTLAPYTFTFKGLNTLPTGVTVELEDLSLNITQDLLIDSTYDTWGAPSDDEERFMLHFNPSNVTFVVNPSINPEPIISHAEGLISVHGLGPFEQGNLRVVDVCGRVVLDCNVNSEKSAVRVPLESFGIYSIILDVRDKRFTKKLVL